MLPDPPPHPPPRWRRRHWIPATLIVVAVLAVAALHTAPVRRLALQQLQDALNDSYGLTLGASALSYNLLTLSATLRDVVIARADNPEQPFAAAEAVSVEFGARTLTGAVDIRQVSLLAPQLTVHRNADETTNLPSGSAGGGTPGALSIPPITADDLTLVVELPGATIKLRETHVEAAPQPDAAVRLTLIAGRGLSIDTGARTVEIDRATLQAVLRDSRLEIEDLMVERPGTTARAGGTIDLAGEAAIEARLEGTTDLASWASGEPAARGTVAITARASGALGRPAVTVEAESGTIVWSGVEATRIAATATWQDTVVRLDHVSAGLAGGRIAADGAISLDPAVTSRIDARWSGVEASRLAPDTPGLELVAPDGRAAVTWRSPTSGGAPQVEVRASSGLVAAGATTPVRLDLRGQDDRWRIALATTDPAFPDLQASAGLRFYPDRFQSSIVDGRVTLGTASVAAVLSRLRDFGIGLGPVRPETTRGAVEAEAVFRGPLRGVQVAGRISGRGVAATGLPATNLDATFDLDVGRRYSAGAFNATVPEVTLAGSPVPDDLAVGGSMTAHGTWKGPFVDPTVEVTLEGRDLRAEWTGNAPVFARDASLALDVSGTIDALDGGGRLEIAAVEVDGHAVGPVGADLTLAAGRGTISLQAPAIRTTVGATVDSRTPYAFEGRAAITDAAVHDIAGLTGLSGTTADLAGTVTATADFGGTLASLADAAVTVRVPATTATIYGVSLSLVDGVEATLRERRVAVENLRLMAGTLTLEATGDASVDGTAGRVTAEIDGDIAGLAPWGARLGQADPLAAAGRLRARLATTLDSGALEIDGSAAATLDRVTQGDLLLAHDVTLDAAVVDGRLVVRQLTGAVLDGPVEAHGDAPLAWLNDWLPGGWRVGGDAGPATLEATGAFDLPAVMAALDRPNDAGIAGQARLAASFAADHPDLRAITGEVALDDFQLRTGDYAYAQTSPTRLALRDGVVTIQSLNWGGPGSTVRAEGQIGLVEPSVTNVRVDLDTRLGILGALFAGRATGHVLGTVALAGQPSGELDLRGDLALTEASWLLPEQRLLFAGWGGRLQLNDSAVEVTSLGGTVNGGRVRIDGRLPLRSEAPGGTVTLVARDILLDVPQGLHSQLGADLAWRAAEDGPVVEGTVTVTANQYREPVTTLLALVESFAPSGTGGSGLPPPLAATSLDVKLHVTDPVVLDNSLGSVELVPDLQLTGTLASPVVLGRIEILDQGRVQLGGRTWRLRDSRLTFAPTGGGLPTLDVLGEAEISDYDVSIRITGTPAAIETTYSSIPPLGERELQSLVVTGQTDSLSGDTGESYAISSAASDILGFAGKFVGLDSVSLGNADFDLVSSNVSAAQHLTVSKSLGRRFEVILSDNLEDGALTWIIIARPASGYEIRVASIENTTSTLEFRQTLQFGPGVSARRSAAPVVAGSPPGARVDDVRVTGHPGFPDAEVRGQLRLGIGDRFDARQWIEDRLRLQRFYRDRGYHRVRIVPARTTTDGADGAPAVTLSYAVERGPRTVIDTFGDPLPDQAVDAMYDAWRGLPIADVVRSEFVRIAREALARRGHYHPTVEVVFDPETPALARATLRVERGPRIENRMVAWSGNRATTDTDLDALVDAGRDETDVWSDPDPLVSSVRRLYASRGYPSATITVGDVEFEGTTARLPIAIEEGPPARIAAVALDGADPGRHDAAVVALDVAPGTPFTPAVGPAGTRRLLTFYRGLGYRDAAVTHAVTTADNGAATMTWTVEEGPLHIVEALTTTGVESTNRGLVREAITLQPGMPLAAGAIDETRRRLYDIGSFRRIDFDFGQAVGGRIGGVQPIDVAIAAEEPRRFQFRYGVQLNSDRSFFGSGNLSVGVGAEVRDRNLFGRAMQGAVGVQWAPEQQTVGLLLSSPRVFGRNLPVSLYGNDERDEGEVEGIQVRDRLREINVDQRWRPFGSTELVWGYTFSSRHLSLIAGTEPLDIDGRLAGPNVSLVLDHRDSPFDATRGFFHSSNVQVGVEVLGSDLGYGRYLARQSHYQRVGPVVLAANGRYGTMRGYSGTVPLTVLSLLFRPGGTNSVRGYTEGSLSALNAAGLDLGGTEMLILNGEVRATLSRWIGAAAFVDGGNSFARPSAVALRDLAVGAGVGLRINTPLAPLRFDFAWPLTDRFGQHGLRVHFSVGQMF